MGWKEDLAKAFGAKDGRIKWFGMDITNYAKAFIPTKEGPPELSPEEKESQERQKESYELLRRTALGEGPSIAAEQAKQQLAQGNRAILSAALSGNQNIRNPGLMARNVALAQAENAGSAARAGALARTQEQLNAYGLMANTANVMRAEDQARYLALQQLAQQQAQYKDQNSFWGMVKRGIAGAIPAVIGGGISGYAGAAGRAAASTAADAMYNPYRGLRAS